MALAGPGPRRRMIEWNLVPFSKHLDHPRTCWVISPWLTKTAPFLFSLSSVENPFLCFSWIYDKIISKIKLFCVWKSFPGSTIKLSLSLKMSWTSSTSTPRDEVSKEACFEQKVWRSESKEEPLIKKKDCCHKLRPSRPKQRSLPTSWTCWLSPEEKQMVSDGSRTTGP